MLPRHGECRSNTAEEKKKAQYKCTEKINPTRYAEDSRQQAHRDQHECIDNDLLRGDAAIGFHHRQHQNPGAAVIFAIHPGDGEKMWELPEKQDSEEHPSLDAECPRRSSPTN